MTLKSGPNLGLLVNGNLGEEHYAELMRQFRGFDLLIQPRVLDKDLSAPPGSPADGAAYIVGGNPTGAWSGKAGNLARWSADLTTPAWEFFVPKEGWSTWVDDEDARYQYVGNAWSLVPTGGAVSDLPADPRIPTDSTTLVVADGAGGIHMNVASANTLTVPSNSTAAIPIKTTIPVLQRGAGKTTIVAASGVTVNVAAPLTLGMRAQWSQVALTKIDTNVWVLTGDLA